MFKTRKTRWRRLENAAKIFPATSNKRDERVFRVSCELSEKINPDVLQGALDKTINHFSMFLCVIRKGIFWNYMEETNLRPVVKLEDKPPCSRMYFRDKRSLLFEVTYYNKRINFEIFHALSDGTGAVQFLRMLAYNYLIMMYPNEVKGSISKLNIDVSDNDKNENGFTKYYEKRKENIKIPKYKAAKIGGDKLEKNQLNIIEGVVSTKELLKIAREHNTTITVILASILLKAVAADMNTNQKKKPISIMIPVNLRKLFPSDSMRNFFWWVDLGYNFSTQSSEFEDIVRYVDNFFKTEITKERMSARMNPLIRWEKNIFLRVVPLELKQLVLQAGQISSRGNTAIFSNVGRIDMPSECSRFIKMFDAFTSTPKMELVTCSYEDIFTITFTSVYENTNIIKNFFRQLSKLELEVEIAARINE